VAEKPTVNNLVTVSGTTLPTPSTYSGQVSDIVDNGRNTQGELVADVIRSNVAKIELTWNYLSVSDWSKILNLFYAKDNSKFINSVTFFDQVSGEFATRRMYVSDRTNSGLIPVYDGSGNLRGWSNCKLSLIEC